MTAPGGWELLLLLIFLLLVAGVILGVRAFMRSSRR
jgi:hypothetical protein